MRKEIFVSLRQYTSTRETFLLVSQTRGTSSFIVNPNWYHLFNDDMTDPLSAVASSFAVIEMSAAVLSVCLQYAHSVIDAPRAIFWIIKEIESLKAVLEELRLLEDKQNETKNATHFSIPKSLYATNGPLETCEAALKEIHGKIKFRAGLAAALIWPLREKYVRKVLDVIEIQKTTLSLALSADETRTLSRIEKSMEESSKTLSDVKLLTLQTQHDAISHSHERENDNIIRWLQSTDCSTNHNTAWEQHEPKTGSWLLDSREFVSWMERSNRLLWLFGIPGCGKTVLGSAVIEHVKDLSYSPQSDFSYAYYYFDFNDPEKQKPVNMLRSILAQLCFQQDDIPDRIKTLYETHDRGLHEPNTSNLRSALLDLANNSGAIYIILDALDECSQKEILREIILDFYQRENISLFVTSRKENAVESVMMDMESTKVSAESWVIDADIKLYIKRRLKNDLKLSRWPDAVKLEIETALLNRARGMFRLVSCQLDIIRSCFNLRMLRERLEALPETLYGTYDRILMNIPRPAQKEVKATLTWLIFMKRPMTLEEISEAIVIDQQDSSFNTENRLLDIHDILDMCSSLVKFSEEGFKNMSSNNTPISPHVELSQSQKRLQLAHRTVAEYLLSEQAQQGPAAGFAISKDDAQIFLVESCLVYLLSFGDPDSIYNGIDREFPFINYAARYWYHHYHSVPPDSLAHSPRCEALMLNLFDDRRHFHTNWLKTLSDNSSTEVRNLMQAQQPLYTACYYGLTNVFKSLIDNNAILNAYGGRAGTALHLAAELGYVSYMQLLIDKGAEVNVVCGEMGHALQAAASAGKMNSVQLLLQNGAEVNMQGGRYGTAIRGAVLKGSIEIVRELICKGANVNCQAGPNISLFEAIVDRNTTRIATLISHKLIEAIRKYQLQDVSSTFSQGIQSIFQQGRSDINTLKDSCEKSWYTTYHNSLSIIELLQKGGAIINPRGAGGLHDHLDLNMAKILQVLFRPDDYVDILWDYGLILRLKEAVSKGSKTNVEQSFELGVKAEFLSEPLQEQMQKILSRNN